MTPDNAQNQRRMDAKFAGGLAWTAGVKWATQLITWGCLAVVARLLTPGDYGIGEIAGIFVGITNIMAEFGIGTAVLHMPDLNRRTLGQLHTFSLLLCTGIFGIALLAAPGIAWFFRSDHVMYFAVANVAFLITGIQAVPYGLLQRDMDYRRLALLEAAGGTVAGVVTVICAWLGWGFWAILAGHTSGKIVSAAVLLFWKHVPFKWPRWNDIRTPVEMGRQVAVSRVAAQAYGTADGIVIGRTLGPAVLGTYGRAMNFASAPAEKISTLIMRTVSPLFANVMDDLPLVRRYYLITVEMLSLAVLPLMTGLAFVAPQAVQLVLGPGWDGVVRPLQFLGLYMIMRVLGVLTEQVLVSQRMTRFTMRIAMLNFLVMPLAFFFAARWKGANGVAAAWFLLSPVTIAPLVIVLLRRIKLPLREFAGSLVPAAAGSAVMCAALFALNTRLASWSIVTRLAIQVAVGGAVYLGFIAIFFRGRILRYVNFVQGLRKPKDTPNPVAS
jgi:O-antigen/teichoic acid export membrane protein